jgi:hypothetical protein
VPHDQGINAVLPAEMVYASLGISPPLLDDYLWAMQRLDVAPGFGIPLLLSQASCGKIFIRDFLPLRVKGLLP